MEGRHFSPSYGFLPRNLVKEDGTQRPSRLHAGPAGRTSFRPPDHSKSMDTLSPASSKISSSSSEVESPSQDRGQPAESEPHLDV